MIGCFSPPNCFGQTHRARDSNLAAAFSGDRRDSDFRVRPGGLLVLQTRIETVMGSDPTQWLADDWFRQNE